MFVSPIRKHMAKTVPLHKKRNPPIYKYRLKELIADLPKSVSMASLEKTLFDEHGITQNEFYRDRIMPYGSKSSIPGDRLIVYGKIFQTTVEDMMYDSIKAKPLVQTRIKSPLA